MAPKPTCGSHDIMLDLIKEQRESSDEIKRDISALMTGTALTDLEVKNLISQFESFRDENERHNMAITERLDKMYILVERRGKWRPQHFVAIASTAILSAGTVLAAWV